MKKLSKLFAIALVFTFLFANTAYAGGAPGAHGLSGSEFGRAVSAAAQSEPGALAEHTSGGKAGGKGAPEIHGVTGRTFGRLVSGLEPGSISDHVGK